MRIALLWLFAVMACGSYLSAEDRFARLLYGPSTDVVGPIRKESAGEMTIYDLRSLQEKTFPSSKILKLEKDLTDDQAVKYVGLPPIVAYRISERSVEFNKSGQATGKIAQVTPTAVYVAMGTKQGVRVGQKLSVFRPGTEIRDPDSGKVLARERPKVAEIEVFEASEAFCKGRLVGGLEIALHTGDEVDGEVTRFMIGVLPITDEAGVESVGGNALREQIVTALVKQDVPVVERSQLSKVLNEELLQNSRGWFDPAQAQVFGKQLGANMVVVGKVTSAGSAVEAHVRLVNVGTGQILLTVSGTLKEDVSTPLSAGKAIATGNLKELMDRARSARLSERKALIKEIADTKSPMAAQFLAEEMLTKDPFTTSDALVSMGPVAADALVKVIDTGDFHQRVTAMRTFSKVATAKHIPFLKKLLSDIHLKSEAERAIKRIQNYSN
ncbi:MAG TPA: CsgG/HfaB family protein [Pirellulales bacterium]|nr:CsgG/HfaB family protein [Pirellulales bacterium]